ncbi:MAG TPA: ankyrin repeat domain-containing protein [Pyrinomonadaceae bacterium]|nr:ankyrin repeat domain-containing protein [Pyrinomonadaceae bacterium]
MTRQRNLLLSLLLVFLSAATPAAFAQEELNDQLFEAARKGDAATVKSLLDRGVDVNSKFRYGATALSYAADKGHLEVVKVLLERKADTNVKDTFYGATPIVWAAQKGHAKIVEALIAAGAEGREDALQIGAGGGHLELVKVVLAAGNLKAEALTGALSAATRAKNAEIADLLTKAGAVPPPKADFKVDAETLNSYVGTYKLESGAEFNAVVKDGVLIIGPPGQQLTLDAFDKLNFRPREFDGVTVTFNVDNGVVTGFTTKRGTNTQVFKKIK